MNPLSKGLGILFGIPIVLTVIFVYYFMSTAEERMRSNCEHIRPGISIEQLALFAKEHNLTTPNKEATINFLEEKRNFGRHACKIVFDAGLVKSSEYSHTN
jgi:hypothetical protein